MGARTRPGARIPARAPGIHATPFLLLTLLSLPLLVCGCGTKVTSAATAVDRLNRMAVAEASLAYEGMKTVTVHSGSRVWERFYYVSWEPGRGTLLERVGNSRKRRPRWNRWWPRLYWLKDRELLLRNYRVVERGEEEVAERPGVILEIRPVHPGRPRMRLVVDRATGLLLDFTKIDYRGEVVFRSWFTALRVTGPVSGDGSPTGRSSRRGGSHRGQTGGVAPFRVLRPSFLPAGFEPRGERLGKNGLRQVWSDGLTWIEIVERRASPGVESNVVRQWCRGSRVQLRVNLEGVEVRLVGRIDPAELVGVLESMQ